MGIAESGNYGCRIFSTSRVASHLATIVDNELREHKYDDIILLCPIHTHPTSIPTRYRRRMELELVGSGVHHTNRFSFETQIGFHSCLQELFNSYRRDGRPEVVTPVVDTSDPPILESKSLRMLYHWSWP